MSTYAIGDIQGCFAPLQKLLEKIQFNPAHDILWLTGDLVNRGPESLETLRFIKSLGNQHRIVLGNHDLHLLAVAYGIHTGHKEDTLHDILDAEDRNELIAWLSQLPLLIHDEKSGYTMVHAGLAPSWNLATAISLAQEVSAVLKSDQAREFFRHMYGNQPNAWRSDLTGWDRIRCITNYLTRVRFCHPDGSLELENKGKIEHRPADLMPWFQVPNRANANLKIIFGHWAALGGVTNTPNIFALDTGCVWGYCLTAMRLEDGERISVSCT
ncbi:MAG: symmetrical bis(5'-nucleosyl)-tetraphosphatase [Gammaproteobacteria bacterium]